MKNKPCKLMAAFTTAAILGSAALAQTAVQTTTTTGGTTVTAGTTTAATTTATVSEGTISEFSPNTIVVRSTTAPEPLRYIYRKTTTYVDETGAPVSIETVKSGLPVTVHYDREGDQLVASRVVVRRSVQAAPVQVVPAPAPAVVEKRATTTTTTTTKKSKKDDDDDDDDKD